MKKVKFKDVKHGQEFGCSEEELKDKLLRRIKIPLTYTTSNRWADGHPNPAGNVSPDQEVYIDDPVADKKTEYGECASCGERGWGYNNLCMLCRENIEDAIEHIASEKIRLENRNAQLKAQLETLRKNYITEMNALRDACEQAIKGVCRE